MKQTRTALPKQAQGKHAHLPGRLTSRCWDSFFCNGAEQCDGNGACVSPGDPCKGGPTCRDTCSEEQEPVSMQANQTTSQQASTPSKQTASQLAKQRQTSLTV